MRGAKRQNPDPRMIPFREKLIELGYTDDTICGYCTGVRRYIREGQPLNADKANKYFEEAAEDGKPFLNKHQIGILKFIDFIDGKTIVRRPKSKSGNGRSKFFKCDDDCFNCKYDDCIMPDYCCTSIPYWKWIGATDIK